MKVQGILAAVAVTVSVSGANAHEQGHSHVSPVEWTCSSSNTAGGGATCSTYNAPGQPTRLINTTIIYVRGTDKRAGKEGIPSAPLPVRR